MRGWSAYRMDEVRWVRSELITCWNKFQIRWKIIGQVVFNSTWRSWNTGWSVLSAKILEWWSWWSERVRCWQDGGWGMTWNYQEHRATEAESEMDEVQEFAERNLQEFGTEVVANCVGFTIICGAQLYRARTGNTKRYIVFCILLTFFLRTTGSGITFYFSGYNLFVLGTDAVPSFAGEGWPGIPLLVGHLQGLGG